MKPHTLFLEIAIVSLLAFSSMPNAQAGTQLIDLSADAGWRTTTDSTLGNQWGIGNFNPADGVAAWVPYGNTSTPTLNPNHMMWNCGSNGSSCAFDSNGNSLGSGPTEVYFGLSFFVKPGAIVPEAGIAIIADDFFDLVINGHHVLAAVIDNHLSAGQPIPIVLDSATLTPFFHTGNNILAIKAMDGHLKDVGVECADDPGQVREEVSTNLGAFCKGQRGNEYLFINGSASVVPEPTTLSLMALGMAGFAAFRKRRIAGE